MRRAILRSVQKSGWIVRRLTSRYRMLPDFIIVGAMKSGTTSLFNYLGQHPHIKPGLVKEIHYFDRNLDKGFGWYKAHFPLKSLKSCRYKTGEASPSYMFIPAVAERIYELLPNVKIIAILRNPTDRAISHFYHEVNRKRESHPLKLALKLEDERIGKAKKHQEYCDTSYIHFSYKERGRYFEQLDRYRKVFAEKNMMLIDFSEFKENPEKTIGQVLKFLGIDEEFNLSDQTPRNVGIVKAHVPAAVRNELDSYFSLHNEMLRSEFSFKPKWRE